jgi:hypothetical protein
VSHALASAGLNFLSVRFCSILVLTEQHLCEKHSNEAKEKENSKSVSEFRLRCHGGDVYECNLSPAHALTHLVFLLSAHLFTKLFNLSGHCSFLVGLVNHCFSFGAFGISFVF